MSVSATNNRKQISGEGMSKASESHLPHGIVMTPVQRQQLADYLATGIFQCGEDSRRPTTRIQFKSGKWPDDERDEGGLCHSALSSVISALLQEVGKSA